MRKPPSRRRATFGAVPKEASGWDIENDAAPPETCCKHGVSSCERCGTTDRRDARHTTQSGLGAVARIRQPRKGIRHAAR